MTMAKNHWSVAAAKASFSRVLHDAEAKPQVIDNRGTPVAVVISIAAYRQTICDPDSDLAGARWRKFLAHSAALRKTGGVTLDIPPRQPRRDPFEDKP
jgi:prevent-host-death family protein